MHEHQSVLCWRVARHEVIARFYGRVTSLDNHDNNDNDNDEDDDG